MSHLTSFNSTASNTTLSNTTLTLKNFHMLEGTIIPHHYVPSYVILSFSISLLGSCTAVELLNRRTAVYGLTNCFLLLSASTYMGGAAIWCMHFAGNRAMILGGGDPELRIIHSQRFTVASFFLTIIGLLLAFGVMGESDRLNYSRIILGSILVGFSMCGMFYVGQAGITNYECIHYLGYVIGATLVAVVGSVIALTVFFSFRARWVGSWPRRGLVGLLLAGAASGMNWLGSVGTQYRLKSVNLHSSPRTNALIVVIVMSVAAGLTLIGLSLLFQVRKIQLLARAQQMVLATAIFDPSGNILVTREGLLPTQKITDSFVVEALDEDFGTNHPIYLWMFKIAHNWSAIKPLIRSIRKHVNDIAAQNYRLGILGQGVNLVDQEGLPIENWSIVLRELFCIAAANLADDLERPLEEIGILFNQIIVTGQSAPDHKQPFTLGRRGRSVVRDSSVDLEQDKIVDFGKGQLLFLISRARRQTISELQAAGFRFAPISSVIGVMADSLQVRKDSLLHCVEVMKLYVNESNLLEPGCYLACFAIRASLLRGGLDILVRKDAKNLLPSVRLPLDTFEDWQLNHLKQLDGSSVSECLKLFQKTVETHTGTAEEQAFAGHLLIALDLLKKENPIFTDAILFAQPVLIPCRRLTEYSPPRTAQNIVFTVIVPIHTPAFGTKLGFSPLNLFKVEQLISTNSLDYDLFVNKIYSEFPPVIGVEENHFSFDNPLLKSSKNRAPLVRLTSSSKKPESADYLPTPFLHLLKVPSDHRSRGRLLNKSKKKHRRRENPWSNTNLLGETQSESESLGGITISHHISIDIKDKTWRNSTCNFGAWFGEKKSEPANFREGEEDQIPQSKTGKKELLGIELRNLNPGTLVPAPSSKAGMMDPDERTFVDDLLALTIRNRRL
ncbi:hypothetical protein B7494_g8078 [Chlorociboria aeruginascens]|nr:hypothetical protein B7494_g8078 [Chlorociboria aeruginascens]